VIKIQFELIFLTQQTSKSLQMRNRLMKRTLPNKKKPPMKRNLPTTTNLAMMRNIPTKRNLAMNRR
jgi:hypothetical protein